MTFAFAVRTKTPLRSLFRPSLRCLSTGVSSIKTVGVVGAGQMGVGIAHVAAHIAKTPNVLLLDSDQRQLEKSVKLIDILLEKDILKGRITKEEKAATLARIRTTDDINDFSEVDFAIEAVSENPSLKRELFQNLDRITKPHAILATTHHRSRSPRLRLIGMHFMNPVPVMKLVEIIPGWIRVRRRLRRHLSCPSLLCSSRGIYFSSILFFVFAGIATKEDIDTTMKLGTNVPMGPLTLADFIGLDTCLSIMRVLHTQLGDTKYRPSPLLVKYVDAGYLGKKTGRGFYTYNK
ncbi:3-hydroxyacyl-CoA dehydrogenase [Chytridium lagenaria]|nr:3-hydroxyacyl-CoA dehydrogenase [Chytridium lagenaria]